MERTVTYSRFCPSIGHDSNRQKGLTLAEILVTLVIMSFIMVGSGIAFQKISPRWALDNAKTQILVDLKQARSVGQGNNEEIILIPTDEGYKIESLKLVRILPRHVKAGWPDHDKDKGIILNRQSFTDDIEFSLLNDEEKVSIIVERLTGRIYATP